MTAYPHNHPDVIQAAQAGDQAARDTIVMGYTRMVYREAAKYARAYRVDLEDLVQEGYMAVLKAITGYNAGQGYAISTYVGIAIRNAVIRNTEIQMNVPLGTLSDLPNDAGRRPLLNSLIAGIRSLDDTLPGGKDEERTLGDVFAGPDDTEGEALDGAFRAYILEVIKASTTSHRAQALILYYGLDGQPPMGGPEIAKMLGCSPQNVDLHLKNGRNDVRRALMGAEIKGAD